MRYLPSKDSYPWDNFWSSLITKIGDRVKSTPVLCPANPSRPLRLIKDVREHVNRSLDSHGKPLFPDIEPEIYLSARYQFPDLSLLRNYGLQAMTMNELLARAKHDLGQPQSRMKSTIDEGWHSSAAICLQYPFEVKPTQLACMQEVRELRLLPLRDGRWTSITAGIVYLPQVDSTDLEIPSDLKLDVLSPKVLKNLDRKRLFEYVGVQKADVPFIRSMILERYEDDACVSLTESVYHLKFLYLTQHLNVGQPFKHQNMLSHLYRQLRVFLDRGTIKDKDKDDDIQLFIQDDKPYGAADLLNPTAPGPNPGDGAPGFDHAFFVNDAYFEDPPEPPTRESLPWKEWFYDKKIGGVRRLPKLDKDDYDAFSDITIYIHDYRPDKILGFLRAAWDPGTESCEPGEELVKSLAEITVYCRGNVDCRYPLSVAYLPTKELENLCNRFMLNYEFFPWLLLEDTQTFEKFPSDWEALGKAVGLGFNESPLVFILGVLKWIRRANSCAEELDQPKRLYDLYNYLLAKVRESTDKSSSEKEIQ